MTIDAEEELGDELMAWWDGQGVPLVLAAKVVQSSWSMERT